MPRRYLLKALGSIHEGLLYRAFGKGSLLYLDKTGREIHDRQALCARKGFLAYDGDGLAVYLGGRSLSISSEVPLYLVILTVPSSSTT